MKLNRNALIEQLDAIEDDIAKKQLEHDVAFKQHVETELTKYPVVDLKLRQLRSALTTIIDEEVSTSALASMGFRNLEWFWRRAAEIQASS